MNECGFILVLDGSQYKDMYCMMFKDIANLDYVRFVTENNNSGILKTILVKEKVQRITKGKLDFLVDDKNDLYYEIDAMFKKFKKVNVIFLNAALYYNKYLAGTLKSYKHKWRGLSYTLLYLDIMDSGVCRSANYLREAKVFDYVYTIDQKDAARMDAQLIWTPYSKNEEFVDNRTNYDLYFCGASKNREELLTQIAKQALENGVDVRMDIVFSKDAQKLEKEMKGVSVKQEGTYIAYSQTLNNSLEAKCILEIVQPGQRALTIRPFEAVCYQRKLLTNNKTIKEFPFYNSSYMQYFEKIEDIDWEWIKGEQLPQYMYCDEFSPANLLEDVRQKIFR